MLLTVKSVQESLLNQLALSGLGIEALHEEVLKSHFLLKYHWGGFLRQHPIG